MDIEIKNPKVFSCDKNEEYHWSKLPKLKELMRKKIFNLQHLDLSKATLRDTNLHFVDLSNSNLSKANLYNADLRDACLNNANLKKANFYAADLQCANLQNADLRDACLNKADLQYANLYNADLQRANLYKADLQRADLSNSNLSNANLYNADLSNANLQYADLSDANLYKADLQNADLQNAKLKQIGDKEVIVEDFMSVNGLGSCNRQTLIFKTNIGIVIQCGCFYGTEKEFKKRVKETYEGNNYEKEYLEMVKLAKIRFNREGLI